MRRGNHSTGTGFTLIELLVVVAILALLISVLLPSLSRARDQARAAVCGGKLRECTRGAQMWFQDLNKDKISTIAGWASGALKQVGGQTELFTCPADPNPKPCPAVLVEMYWAPGIVSDRRMWPPPYAIASPDGPLNRFSAGGRGTLMVDMPDRQEGTFRGYDFNADIRIQFAKVPIGTKMATSSILTPANPNDDFRVTLYNGKLISSDLKTDVGAGKLQNVLLPLIWGSYGMNVYAGAKNAKGNPVVLTEYGKWGVVPLQVKNPKDILSPDRPFGTKLRLRHNGKLAAVPPADAPPGMIATSAQLRDSIEDPQYEPRNAANCGFQDGHVERLSYSRIMDPRAPIWTAGIDGDVKLPEY